MRRFSEEGDVELARSLVAKVNKNDVVFYTDK
jgi:hypothetical protein